MRPFWQQLILSLLGPLSTAVIGTFLLGLWAAWVTQRWQARKEDAALRESLIRELLEASSALSLALRHYEHLVDYPESWRDMPRERKALDDVYVRTGQPAMLFNTDSWRTLRRKIRPENGIR